MYFRKLRVRGPGQVEGRASTSAEGFCGFLTAEPLRLDAAVGASKEGAHGMRARWRRTPRAGQRAAAVSWDHFFALFLSALRMAEAPAAPRIPPGMRMKSPPGRCRARRKHPDGENSARLYV